MRLLEWSGHELTGRKCKDPELYACDIAKAIHMESSELEIKTLRPLLANAISLSRQESQKRSTLNSASSLASNRIGLCINKDS
ncbi:C-Type Lectin Domain Family 4 Member F [Manis pentadactyla]|nr:C-Type Lectin Domain Family 4 Member F [Manis pentadactyla]